MRNIVEIQVVNGSVQWQVTKLGSGGYVAVCEPLALSMEGDSLDFLEVNIYESIQLLLTDLLEEGELEAFLSARGWRATKSIPAPDGDVKFDVPYQLLVNYGNDQSRKVYQ
jgi:predicted RNase H-like HicB family nuclease